MIKIGNPIVLQQSIERMKPIKEKINKINIESIENGFKATFNDSEFDLHMHFLFEIPRHRWRSHIWASMRYNKNCLYQNSWKRYYK